MKTGQDEKLFENGDKVKVNYAKMKENTLDELSDLLYIYTAEELKLFMLGGTVFTILEKTHYEGGYYRIAHDGKLVSNPVKEDELILVEEKKC